MSAELELGISIARQRRSDFVTCWNLRMRRRLQLRFSVIRSAAPLIFIPAQMRTVQWILRNVQAKRSRASPPILRDRLAGTVTAQEPQSHAQPN